MGKPKRNVAKSVETHLIGLEEAIKIEDIGTAVKWLFKLPKAPENPREYFDGLRNLELIPLYADAVRANNEILTGEYTERVKIARKTLFEFETIFKERYAAGLVLVVHDRGLAQVLFRSGFDAQRLEYQPPSSVSYVSEESWDDYKPRFQARDAVIEDVVNRIIQHNPRLVVCPLLKRVNERYTGDKDEPVFDPEGPMIHNALRSKGKETPFLGVIGFSKSDGIYWGNHKIPYANSDFPLIMAATKALKVR